MVAASAGKFGIRGLVPDNPIALQAELGGRLSEVVAIQVDPGTQQSGQLHLRTSQPAL